MESFLMAYGVNTLASIFDLTTTAILHEKTGNPDEFKFVREEMNDKGSVRGALEGESVRRIGFLAIGLLALGGESLYTHIAHQAALPVHDYILYGMALIYATAGLFNLIPITFDKRKNN